jgi:hypothetical protein
VERDNNVFLKGISAPPPCGVHALIREYDASESPILSLGQLYGSPNIPHPRHEGRKERSAHGGARNGFSWSCQQTLIRLCLLASPCRVQPSSSCTEPFCGAMSLSPAMRRPSKIQPTIWCCVVCFYGCHCGLLAVIIRMLSWGLVDQI